MNDFPPRRRWSECPLIAPSGFSLAVVGMLLGLSLTCRQGLAQDAAPQRLLPEPAREEQAPSTNSTSRPTGGETFTSLDTGVQLDLPPGQRVPSPDPNTLVIVTDPEKEWRFEVQRLLLERPATLQSEDLPEGGRRVGLLDLVADDLVRDTKGELLRKSITPLANFDAGVIVLRHPFGSTTQLRQVALIPASDTLFYRLVLASPAPSAAQGALETNENVRAAVDAFARSLDSFELLDLTPVREDQEQRLIRTRSLFVNLNRNRLMDALVPEQWWRVKKDGRDIGYAYVVEEPAADIPDGRGDDAPGDAQTAEGLRVGIRSHIVTDAGTIDRQSWSWMGVEARAERFLEENVFSVDGEHQGEGFVVGSMTARQVPRRVDVPSETGVVSQPLIDVVQERKLEVSFAVSGAPESQSLTRELPAWYVPQVLEHLLPRLVAPWGQKTYLVAVYDRERMEVWQVYVDVEGPREEVVDGEKRLVIVVSLRQGLSGSRTRHFIDPYEYNWLGSVNDATGVEVWPTDAQTINSLWKGADLSRPETQE